MRGRQRIIGEARDRRWRHVPWRTAPPASSGSS